MAPSACCAARVRLGRGADPRPQRAQPRPRLLPRSPALPRLAARAPRAFLRSPLAGTPGPSAGAIARRPSSRAPGTRPRPASARSPAPGASDWRSAGPAGGGGGCSQAGPGCLRRRRLPRSRCRGRAPASCPLPGSRCDCGSGCGAPRRCGSDLLRLTTRAPLPRSSPPPSPRAAVLQVPQVFRGAVA